MATEMYQHEAKEIYNRVRKAYPKGVLPDFGVWPWSVHQDAWCVENGRDRFMVCRGTRLGAGPYVAKRFPHKGEWYTSMRYFEDGRYDS